jgi:pilus assembly protein Flp/PilA
LAVEFTQTQLAGVQIAEGTGRQSGGSFVSKSCRFWQDQSGATAIEYGLIAAGISIAIIATVGTLGTNLNATFSSVSSQLK